MHSFVKFDLTEFCNVIEIPVGNSNARTDVEPTMLSATGWSAHETASLNTQPWHSPKKHKYMKKG